MLPMPGIKWWFENMDNARRRRRARLDRAGRGANETPHKGVMEGPRIRLEF